MTKNSLLKRYIELKTESKKLETEIKELQAKFETFEMDGYTTANYKLVKQARTTTSYNDEVLKTLSIGEVLEVAKVDKKRLENTVPLHLIEFYKQEKTSYAWTYKAIK